MITELEFKSLSEQGYNRIALIEQAFADLDTPLSLYLKLTASQPRSFLLESVVGGERFGRYSFIGLPAQTWVQSTGNRTEVVSEGRVVETHHGNPLDFLQRYMTRFRVALGSGLPRFCGGLAGYFGYDTVRHIEARLSRIHHDAKGVFQGLPPAFEVVRYHSLAIESHTLPAELEVSATSADGEIMAVRHRLLAGTATPVEGVQFHPESILSEHGMAVLANFVRLGASA